MRTPCLLALALVAPWMMACGGEGGSEGGAESVVEDIAESVGEMAASEGESDASMEGSVTFTVDGQDYAFDHVVADETFAMSLSTNAVLKPDPAATESFDLLVVRMDLDDYDYPATLPPEEAGTSIETAGMMVAFNFTNSDGQRWTATGDLEVESFEDDVLVATFGEMEFFDPDSMEPGPTLEGGRLRVAF